MLTYALIGSRLMILMSFDPIGLAQTSSEVSCSFIGLELMTPEMSWSLIGLGWMTSESRSFLTGLGKGDARVIFRLIGPSCMTSEVSVVQDAAGRVAAYLQTL